jgi:Flp pilus assembly secretin CpaC
MDTQEMRTITGWPGASQIGAAGYLDADHTKNSTGDEFIIVITPRLVHSIPHSGKPIYAGRDTTRSGPGQPQ